MSSEAKREAIAEMNSKLGPGGWYSEDLKTGFDFGWEALLDLVQTCHRQIHLNGGQAEVMWSVLIDAVSEPPGYPTDPATPSNGEQA